MSVKKVRSGQIKYQQDVEVCSTWYKRPIFQKHRFVIRKKRETSKLKTPLLSELSRSFLDSFELNGKVEGKPLYVHLMSHPTDDVSRIVQSFIK